MTVPPKDGVYARIPDFVYHSDRDSLSSSGARTLTDLTPADFIEQLNVPPNPKPEYDFGHAAHKMVLGEGSQLVRVDADDWRTKAAREKREKAWAEHKAPLLKGKIALAQQMAGKVFQHEIAAKLLERGAAEMSGYWHDPATGVRLRFRPDFLPEMRGRPIIVDYKSARTANPTLFAKSAADYGYHRQDAWYRDGLIATTGVEDPAFVFIVQQKDPPYLVSVVQLDPEAVELGRRQNRAAIELYARCRESGRWPGYEGITTVGLPRWLVSQIELQLNA